MERTKESNDIKFECLCFDKDGNSVINSQDGFLSRLLGNAKIFPEGASLSAGSIHDEKFKVSCSVKKIDVGSFDYKSAFVISIELKDTAPALKDHFDEMRVLLVKSLKSEGFSPIYILQDDFSAELLSQLYPKINKVENLLRNYLTCYFSLREGLGWWGNTIDEEISKKLNQRKNNEDLFKDDADTRIYLVDFNDVGNMIYSISTGNLSVNDLLKKIQDCGDVDKLKKDVQKNIKKHFSKFEEIGFQEKWEFLMKTRNKIAHNSLISLAELKKADSYLDALNSFLKGELKSFFSTKIIDASVDVESDIKSRQDSFSGYKDVTKKELIEELEVYNRWCKGINRDFLGLRNFVYNIMAPKKYHIGKVWERLEELEKDGFLELYVWKDPANHFPDQEAIKLKE